MFKNYFITAYRNFSRNKVFSSINMLGLSIGISSALVIFLIVYYEYSYDHFEPNKERIYRVVLDASFNGSSGHSAAIPAPMGAAIEKEVTGVEQTIPILQFQGDASANVTIATNKSDNPLLFKKQKDIVFTNAQYFQMLPFTFLAGSASAAMKEPFSVVISESRAHFYFPDLPLNNVVGKEITYNGETRVKVNGIVKDLDETTLFTAKEFISTPTILASGLKDHFMMDTWNDWMAYSQLFIKLNQGRTKEEIEAQIASLYKKYNTHPVKNSTTDFRLQPLLDIHFNPNYPGIGQRLASRTTLFSLLVVAAFLLFLGCINFINLSTAQAAQRAKEIGIRKTMGGSKGQLVMQFLGETLFVTTLASILSVLITPLLLHVFSDFIPAGLRMNLLQQPVLILFLVLLTLLVSFLSGIYPALVLSGYSPVRTLKNQAIANSGQTRGAWIRKGLTITQFVVAQFFIIGTIMVSKQIHYSMNQDLGFNKEAVITFDLPFDTVKSHSTHLLEEIKSIPEVALASSGFLSPQDAGVAFTNIQYKGKEDLKENIQIRWGDTNFIKVYQLPLVAGRNVQVVDSFAEFLINETYARDLGFQHPEDALNKQLQFNGKSLNIVGVMKDFHDQSKHAKIGAVVFAGGKGDVFHIRLQPKDREGKSWQSAIAKIKQLYTSQYPADDFSYSFVDEKIAALYKTEENISRLLLWATGLMIFISCLGLLGLVIYTTNRRRKEIGVRKVLGASVANIVTILSGEFIKLVIIAFIVAIPIAWWAVNKWLNGFAYRTAISWWIFALTAIIIILFSIITLSIQTIRSAVANPVDSLRNE